MLYKILKRVTSAIVGAIITLITLDLAVLAILLNGPMQVVCSVLMLAGMLLTIYWMVTPLEGKRKAAKRADTR